MDPPELSGNYNSPVINKSIEYRYLILGVIFIVVGYLAFKPTVDKYNEERQARLMNEFEDGDVTQSNANIYFKLYGGFIKAGLLLLVYYMYDALLKHLIGNSSIGKFVLLAVTFMLLALYDSFVLSVSRPDNYETPNETPMYNALKIITGIGAALTMLYTFYSKVGANSEVISLLIILFFAIIMVIGFDTFFREESDQLGIVDSAKYAVTPWAQIVSAVAYMYIWATQRGAIKKMFVPDSFSMKDEDFNMWFGGILFLLWLGLFLSLFQHVREGRLTVTYKAPNDKYRYFLYDDNIEGLYEMYKTNESETEWTWMSKSAYRKNWSIILLRYYEKEFEAQKDASEPDENLFRRNHYEIHGSERIEIERNYEGGWLAIIDENFSDDKVRVSLIEKAEKALDI